MIVAFLVPALRQLGGGCIRDHDGVKTDGVAANRSQAASPLAASPLAGAGHRGKLRWVNPLGEGADDAVGTSMAVAKARAAEATMTSELPGIPVGLPGDEGG